METAVAEGSELHSFTMSAHGVSEKGVALLSSAAPVCDTPGIAGGRFSVDNLDDILDVLEGGGESEGVELDGIRSSIKLGRCWHDQIYLINRCQDAIDG